MTVRATMIIDKINGTTVNVIPAIANPLPLDDFLALIPNISPVIDKINAKIRKGIPASASPTKNPRNINKIEKIPVINETIAEPNLSFCAFTTLVFV
ncbi:hypothetical protein PAALTS15_03812 [Paenibacillus alvei TS-15]|jgi:hypothetical protein|uniref:Uncharacterized protein n=1 Tax=Paenibacillus alvei TS-15 TaxID=1117108 RepID=S9UDY1_PAEAL|nr:MULTISPECIES: hypothetical protein [Paenibacillus]EPY08670.1 hypothetical protein PAALTS15_03812 [Paenibacillus alvei TS-15]OBY76508.1 hypothetical protein BBG47_26655 [Paenibacillus sp. KS1]